MSGDFATGADWSNDTAPSATDDAIINAAGTYTVTNTASASVAALTVGVTGVQLTLADASTFAAGALTNSGTISILDGSTLELAGTVTNSGTIDLAAMVDLTDLALSGVVTVSIPKLPAPSRPWTPARSRPRHQLRTMQRSR